ncbi:MAG: hypothetical protein Q8M55_00015 [Actinomycetota bacterium]|nr:hypothetical protein [Actinomycetota bacterium]
MVQLSLIRQETTSTLEEYLAVLEARARRLTGGEAHAEAAARITGNALASRVSRPLAPSDAQRVEAYFLAVLRRRILSARDPFGIRARQRLVAVSIESDLIDAGWPRPRAREEVRRILGDSWPAEGVA